MAGKVIFHNETVAIEQQKRDKLILNAVAVSVVLFVVLFGYIVYLHFNLLKPFKKLQGFALRIAAGNLDIPLEMDKNNLFGAFTESFDLMREELNKARENEHNANRSKKELVASLSHDIKTPVASIKAVTECMIFTMKDDEDRKQLEIVDAKAEQINALITNMFHATLEELQALSVNAVEIESTLLPNIIKNADYEGRVKPFTIPNCLISADLLRLEQIFDNIITNSYKYAGTNIEITTHFEERYLVIALSDFGIGVSDEELPLITNKFYRGKNVENKSGYGLGLYISNYLMEQMTGKLVCENSSGGGFSVRLMLRLAG
jgi:signal transduction histidine kinase